MSTIDINDFDDILEKEFALLGFDYQRIKSNGVNQKENGDCEVLEVIYLDNLPAPARGVSITFTIKNPEIGQPPHIEAMTATVLGEMDAGKFQEIIKKEFCHDCERLRTKQQIWNEAIQLMKIVVDLHKNMNEQITELGFNLRDLSEPIEFVHSNEVCLKTTINDDPRLYPGDRMTFEFMVMSSLANNQCFFIDELNAYLVRKVADSNSDEVFIKKGWSPYEDYLPRKEEIFSQMMDLLKLKEISEKFGFKANSPQCNQSHRATKKKGL